MSRFRLRSRWVAKFILVPTILLTAVGFYGSMIWTVAISFTSSTVLPQFNFVGLTQYVELFAQDRWRVAYTNLFLFGIFYIVFSMTFGFLLAIVLDQGLRAKNFLQTLFLYPIALSFVVTGLTWKWLLNPTTGLQSFVRDLGFTDFQFDWLNRPDMAIFTLVIAGVWNSAGINMAIIFAGLQSIDSEIWRASRVDGIPKFAMYRRVIIPMLAPVLLTCFVLLAMSVIKSYDLVIVMTGGGPGYSTDVPAKFVVDHLFDRGNIGRASAAATLMLLSVFAIFGLSALANRRKAAS